MSHWLLTIRCVGTDTRQFKSNLKSDPGHMDQGTIRNFIKWKINEHLERYMYQISVDRIYNIWYNVLGKIL